MKIDFPILDYTNFWNTVAVFRIQAERPASIEEAPYSEDIKAWFRGRAPAFAEPKDPTIISDLETEARELFRDMKTLGESIKTSDDVKERLAYMKTLTSLLEKLISMEERASSSKAHGVFQTNIMKLIEEVLTPEQRTHVMDRLKEISSL